MKLIETRSSNKTPFATTLALHHETGVQTERQTGMLHTILNHAALYSLPTRPCDSPSISLSHTHIVTASGDIAGATYYTYVVLGNSL